MNNTKKIFYKGFTELSEGPFDKPFFTGTSDIGGSTTAFTPVIGISPYDLDSGDYFVLSNVSGTGFTIVFKNSSDSPIDVKFSFQALGYGKGV